MIQFNHIFVYIYANTHAFAEKVHRVEKVEKEASKGGPRSLPGVPILVSPNWLLISTLAGYWRFNYDELNQKEQRQGLAYALRTFQPDYEYPAG